MELTWKCDNSAHLLGCPNPEHRQEVMIKMESNKKFHTFGSGCKMHSHFGNVW
jgi:hypothetical protein